MSSSMLTQVTYSPRVEIPKLASVLLIIPTLTFVQYVGMSINANQIFDQILWKCRSSVPHEDLRLEPPEIYILWHGFLIFLYILMQAVYALLILSAGLRMNAGHVSWLKRSTDILSTSSLVINLCLLYCFCFDKSAQVQVYLPWLILQSIIGWAFVALEWKWTAERDSMFDSWVVQLFSTWIAYGVFAWRYHNVPQNWEFVGTSLANKVAFLTLASHVAFLGVCAYRVLLFLTLEVGAGSSKSR